MKRKNKKACIPRTTAIRMLAIIDTVEGKSWNKVIVSHGFGPKYSKKLARAESVRLKKMIASRSCPVKNKKKLTYRG